MSFRDRVDMLVVFPKTQLAHYVDNTMPRRDWSRYDLPLDRREFLATRYRKPVSERETAPNILLRRQAG